MAGLRAHLATMTMFKLILADHTDQSDKASEPGAILVTLIAGRL